MRFIYLTLTLFTVTFSACGAQPGTGEQPREQGDAVMLGPDVGNAPDAEQDALSGDDTGSLPTYEISEGRCQYWKRCLSLITPEMEEGETRCEHHEFTLSVLTDDYAIWGSDLFVFKTTYRPKHDEFRILEEYAKRCEQIDGQVACRRGRANICQATLGGGE